MNNTIRKFETGKTYQTRSIGDYNCTFKIEVLKRTAKSIWFKDLHDSSIIIRKSVKVYDGVEEVMPLGTYSMAPRITAEKLVK